MPGLREWQTALRRCVPTETPLLLVAGRIDVGFRASRGKLQSFAAEQGFRYFETSAKEDLWDDLEKLFASDDVRQQVEGLQAVDAIRLDFRRKGKLLALEVSSRIASADQKCFEIPGTEDEGIDMELEFTDDKGKGTGNAK